VKGLVPEEEKKKKKKREVSLHRKCENPLNRGDPEIKSVEQERKKALRAGTVERGNHDTVALGKLGKERFEERKKDRTEGKGQGGKVHRSPAKKAR